MLEMLPKPMGLAKNRRNETVVFHHSAVEKVVLLMRKDPSAKLDWDVLARHAGISRYHFLRVFQEITHFSPHGFLVTLRLQLAKRLLIGTRLPIGEVCVRAGYHSASTFVRIFKAHVGLVPTKFRRLAKNSASSVMRLKPAENLESPGVPALENQLEVAFRFPTPFSGLIFAWFCSATTSDVRPLFSALVNQADPAPLKTRFEVPEQSAGSLRAIAIPGSSDPNDYLLPDEKTCLVASVELGSLPDVHPKPEVILNLATPTLFDPPVLICLQVLAADLIKLKT